MRALVPTRSELLQCAAHEVFRAREHFARAFVCGVNDRQLAAVNRLQALQCLLDAMALRDAAREAARLDALYEALPLVATHGAGPVVVDDSDETEDPWGLRA